jgi:hypothetical protein
MILPLDRMAVRQTNGARAPPSFGCQSPESVLRDLESEVL